MRTRLTLMAGAATLLASIGLYPLYETGRWFWTGFGAVLVVAGTGLLTRRLRLPAIACLLGGLAALLVYLTMLFAAGDALLGVIPTPSSIARIGQLTADGLHEANSYAAPVPVLPGIDIITDIGIGLAALLVDLLAVRLRQAAPSGLPLLAMYSVPAAMRHQGASWFAFLLGAGGYLGLLVVDARERLSGWGRPVFTRYWSADRVIRDRPDSSTLAVSGRRIGLTAVAIAVFLPLAVPGVEQRGLFGVGGGGRGNGLTTVTTPDPLVSLKRQLVRTDDAVVLTYRTNDPAPDYLRMYSLDRFDGNGWTYSPMHGDRNSRVEGRTLPPAQGPPGTAVRQINTKIAIDRQVSGMTVLPSPYPPTKVDIKGDWRVDTPSLMVFSLHDAAGGRTYSVASQRRVPNYQQLELATQPPAEITSRYLDVPQWVTGDIGKLARSVAGDAATPYEKAIKLQQWFTKPGNFTYSLNAPSPRNVGALHDFLFTSRVGYCEQFAASMALMARILGIPARVGMGYTAGTRQADGSWVVHTKDTHAWPELYLTGVGWLRFEPTPAGGLGQGSATVPDYTTPQLVPGGPGGAAANPAPTTGPDATASGRPNPQATALHRADADQFKATGTAPARKKDGPPIWPLVVLALLALLALPLIVRWVGSLRRWAGVASDGALVSPAMTGPPATNGRRPAIARLTGSPAANPRRPAVTRGPALAHAAWDELRASALDYRLPWRHGDSPRAAAGRLAGGVALDEPASEALTRLTLAEERARYARTPDGGTTLRSDVRLVRAAFAKAASRRARLRANLFPPSAAVTLRRAGTRVLDAFDWLDVASIRRRR
jgi:transglutaminase-like putative cysteine protease